MDALDRLAEPALDLLHRVDTLLAEGVGEGHPVWPLLRRLQVLPGEAVRHFLELRPAPLTAAGQDVRALVRGYDSAGAALGDPVAWSGAAATAYGQERAALLRHLDEGPESLVGRLESTAGYAESLADWVDRSRVALARTLAEALGSAEAVAVLAATSGGSTVVASGGRAGGGPGGALAGGPPGPLPGGPGGTGAGSGGRGTSEAAEIARRVLAVLSVAYDGAETLLREWSPSLGTTPWRPAAPAAAPHHDTPTRVGW